MAKKRSIIDEQYSQLFEILNTNIDVSANRDVLFSTLLFRGTSPNNLTIPDVSQLPRADWPIGGYCFLASSQNVTNTVTPAPGVRLNGANVAVNLPAASFGAFTLLQRVGDNEWQAIAGGAGGGGGGGQVNAVQGGTGINVDATDPVNPIVNNAGVLGVTAGANVSLGGSAQTPEIQVPSLGVESVVAGTNISVDATDPANPIVNAGVGGQVNSVVGGTNVSVDNTDPVNPVVSVPTIGGQVNSVVAGTNVTVDNTDPVNPIINATGGGSSAFSGARLRGGISQSIPNSLVSIVTWDQEDYDEGNWHDNVTNNSRLTVPAGVDRIRMNAKMVFASNSTGVRQFELLRNGSTPDVANIDTRINATSDGNTEVTISSGVLEVTPGDYFEMRVLQTSGGNLSLFKTVSYFSIEAVSAPAVSSAFRGALLELNANESIPNSSFTALTDYTEIFDTDNFYDVGNPSRFTIPAGVSVVQLTANVRFNTNGVGNRQLTIRKNGALFAGMPTVNRDGPATPCEMNGVSAAVQVVPGDFFELFVQQTSGGNLDVLNGPRTSFSINAIA